MLTGKSDDDWIEFRVRRMKQAVKTCSQEAEIVVDGTKKVPQATSPSLVSSPRPFDFRLLGLGSSSTNFLFDCLGQS